MGQPTNQPSTTEGNSAAAVPYYTENHTRGLPPVIADSYNNVRVTGWSRCSEVRV